MNKQFHWIILASLGLFLTLFLPTFVEARPPPGKSIECTIKDKCPGVGWGDSYANIKERCMCVGSKCFKIDVGPSDFTTYNGKGKMTANVDGTKYQTKSNTTTTYDKDAIKMGIFNNNTTGKWIHKTNGCTSGGARRTAGCIGVPCDLWPMVKRQAGKNIVVCGAKPNKDSAAENLRKVLAEDGAQARAKNKTTKGSNRRNDDADNERGFR